MPYHESVRDDRSPSAATKAPLEKEGHTVLTSGRTMKVAGYERRLGKLVDSCSRKIDMVTHAAAR